MNEPPIELKSKIINQYIEYLNELINSNADELPYRRQFSLNDNVEYLVINDIDFFCKTPQSSSTFLFKVDIDGFDKYEFTITKSDIQHQMKLLKIERIKNRMNGNK